MTNVTPLTPLWAPPGGAFWAGTWRDTGLTHEVRNPGSGDVVGHVADCGPDDVDHAVRAVADAVLAGPAWPLWQRREALRRAAEIVGERADLLATVISSEGTKTIREARREVTRATEVLRLCAEQADRLEGHTVPFDNTPRGVGRFGWYTREPVGVVAAVTPFNDPLNLVAHKLGPALIGGNGVVLKPAEATPLSALALLEALLDAGVPGGRLAVTPGRGANIGSVLLAHPLIDMVSFTGGAETGDRIARTAGAKKTLMELGGVGTVIVLADSNPAAAAEAVVGGAFGNAGQNCLSVQRVFVARDLMADMTRRVEAGASALVVGAQHDEATDVGPMIDLKNAQRVKEWIDDAVAAGATCVTGGRREGTYVHPTVLTSVPRGARLLVEEVFGPVVCLEAFDELDDVVAEVNSLEFGLQSGVFSEDLSKALDLADRLRVGAVMINDTGDFRSDAMPFGGSKRSGVGREGVPFAVEAMTEPKLVAIKRRPEPRAPACGT